MERRGLGVAQRQLAVAPQLAAEEEHVPGAVHRLDGVGVLVVDRDQEHVLAELLPVARGDPERLVVDQRRLDLGVAAARVLAPAQILERVEDRHPLRVPERRARRVLVEVEEVELRAEPAVVALLRLLEQLQARVEVLLAEERGAVDPGQLRVVRVAAPVGAGERGELERLDRRRVLEVRAAAEVGEVALRIERDRALGGVDELDLVRLALGLEPRAGLVGRDLLALPRASLGELAVHLGLDRLEVGVVDRRREVEVVVEAVLDRRPDRHLDARDGAGAPPRRAGGRRSGGGRRARRDPACRASSGSAAWRRPASGSRRSCGTPSALTSTACSASFGPIARAASRPLEPSGSSSSVASGRMTFIAVPG